MKIYNKVIVVTGAAGGIGSELVCQLLDKGAYVAAIIHKSGLEKMESLAVTYGDKISIEMKLKSFQRKSSPFMDA
jgi:NAD(P)-dependent dehydrogenase (short-subunit alcohol dehydrogenase family)